MDGLNYQHLFYFWAVAREESLTQAAARLRLAPSTISAQVRTLEADLGVRLFDRSGRRLRLTDVGREALQYADEIFALGQDLRQALAEPAQTGRPLRLRVGVADAMPKTVTWRLLRPLFAEGPGRIHIRCVEGASDRLGLRLAALELDLVLTDAPVSLGSSTGIVSRALGACGVSLFATPGLAARVRRGDGALDLTGVPMLVPTQGSSLRRDIDRWMQDRGMRPDIVAEFDNSALLKAAASSGIGVFAMHSVATAEITERLGFTRVGELDGLSIRFQALTRERRLDHPLLRRALDEAASSLAA